MILQLIHIRIIVRCGKGCAVGKARLPVPPLLQLVKQVGLEPTRPKDTR